MRYKPLNPSDEFDLTPAEIEYGQIVISNNGDLCIKLNDPEYRAIGLGSIEGHKYPQDLMVNLVTGKRGWASAMNRFKAVPLHEITFTTNNESKMEK